MREPISLFATREFTGPWSRADCEAIFKKIQGFATGGGDISVSMWNNTEYAAEWGRNDVTLVSDIMRTAITIQRTVRGATGVAICQGDNDEALHEAVRTAERLASLTNEDPAYQLASPRVAEPTLQPHLWDDETVQLKASGCIALVEKLLKPVDDAKLVTAGALRVRMKANASCGTSGVFQYYPSTEVQCSLTVRDAAGTASGWAGMNHYAMSKMDVAALGARALDKAQRSANPVAIEPGRYTAILEPQAVADLCALLFRGPMPPLDRTAAERPYGPFGEAPGKSKITRQVLDSRLTLRSDPMDPDGGFVPFDEQGTPYQPATWIERGTLQHLAYDKEYALSVLGYDKALPLPPGFRLMGSPETAPATVDEMVAHTERGVLITRFSNVQLMDDRSLLCTGYTRDGLWLIEHGKIAKPIRNFRFVESLMFILNNLEEVGTPVRIFAPGAAYIAPPVRVRDFSFVALADAI